MENKNRDKTRRNGGFHKNAGRAPRAEKKASARDAALYALTNVVQNGAYASEALSRQLTLRPLSDEDRRLATNIFYTAAENRLRLEYALQRFVETQPDPTVWDILNIAAAQLLLLSHIPDHAAVDEAVKQARAAHREGLTGMVNAVLRNLIRARDAGEDLLPDREADPIRYISVTYSLGEHIVRRLSDAYGLEAAEQIAAWRPEERLQTVRPNRTQTTLEAFQAYLNNRGLEWRQGLLEDSFLVRGGGDLAGLDAYRHGLFSLQGESSMLAARAVEAKPGQSILDACAAPGGKSAYIAETMQNTGRVYAWDVYEHRAGLIKSTAQRLRLDNLRPSVHDARRPSPQLERAMDAVLVDAPCSGIGVIADKPDIKYRLSEQNLNELLPLQREILDGCADCVKPGGLLVYSTCTILPEENEAQARAFLERHPDFEPEPRVDYLPERLRPLAKDGRLQLMQHRDGVEGFFIARMRRKRG